MTVTARNNKPLTAPHGVLRRAGLKHGDEIEFKVSGGVMNIVSNRMLKKALRRPLRHRRGSVNTCDHVAAFVSRARQQAIHGLFQHPAKPLAAKDEYTIEERRSIIRTELQALNPGNPK
jgi:hypothetical protein